MACNDDKFITCDHPKHEVKHLHGDVYELVCTECGFAVAEFIKTRSDKNRGDANA